MKKPKMNKRTILIMFLMSLPTILLLSQITTHVAAEEWVPVEHPNNEWHWNTTVGDYLWYELEILQWNSTTNEQISMFRNIYGFEITAIFNTTLAIPGEGTHAVSAINMTDVWYNGTDIEILGETSANAFFGYNDTLLTEVFSAGDRGIVPIILPLNGTNTVDLEYLSNIIKTYYYDPMASIGAINVFDYVNADNAKNNLYFGCTSDPYYINATYYDNGTVKFVEMFIQMQMGPGEYIDFYQKAKHVSNPDITTEVEWSVNKGDILYYGDNNWYFGYFEKKYEITGFNITICYGNWSFEQDATPMLFEQVLANVSIWNETLGEYILDIQQGIGEVNATVGIANKFYPTLPLISTEDPIAPLVLNKKATFDDLIFMQNNFTIKWLEGYDEIKVKQDGDLVITELINHTRERHLVSCGNLKSGMINFLKMTQEYGEKMDIMLFEKNMTILTTDAQDEWLYDDLCPAWDIHTDFTVSGDTELYWAVIPINPTNVSLPYGLPHELAMFLDVYTNDSVGIGPVNFTATYDELLLDAYDINETDLLGFKFNTTKGIWEMAPESIITREPLSDRITFDFNDFSSEVYYAIGANTTSKVEWSVGPTDVLYYGGGGIESKVIITEINETVIDITPYVPDASPGVQAFSEIFGDLYFWNASGEEWLLRNSSILITAANNYWPIAPYIIQGESTRTEGPPPIVPMGTTGFDMAPAFMMFEGIFDEAEYYDDHIVMRNNTNDAEFKVFLNSTTGLILNMYGKMKLPGGDGDWQYITFYAVNVEPLVFGANILDIESSLVPELSYQGVIITTGATEFHYSFIIENPVDKPIPDGIRLFYNWIMMPDHTVISSITITITLPSSIDIDEIDLYMYKWSNFTEMGGEYGYWDLIPDSVFNEMITIDSDNNALIFQVTEFDGEISGLFAYAFKLSDIDEEDLPEDIAALEIPGYNLYFIITAIFVVSAIIIKRKRK